MTNNQPSEAKHTHDKWETDDVPDNTCHSGARHRVYHGDHIICYLTDGAYAGEYAQLIAAAPELLESLEILTKLFDSSEHPDVLKARRAIAKATAANVGGAQS